MSDTSETSAIDDKKQTTTTTASDPITETKTFFGALINQLFHLFVVIVAGGAMLWSARVSQTNLMPTDLNCEPFAYSNTEINKDQPVTVNIDVVKMKDDQGTPGIKSTKIEFDIQKNMDIIKFGILGLDSIREWTDGPDSTPFTLYLGTIWQKMAANYSNMMNTFYNILNQNCSESVIIFIMPYIILFVLIGLGIVNGFYGYFLWFMNLYLLFSIQKDCFQEPVFDSDGSPILKDDGTPLTKTRKIWEYTKGEMGRQWYWAILYILVAFFSFSWAGSLILFYFLVRSSISSLFLPLLMVAKVKDSPDQKEYTFSTLLANIFKYKMSVIMYIVSFFIVSDAYSALGALGAFIAIVACFFVYSFYPDIYKQFKPTDAESTDGLALFKQAHKICTKKENERGVCEGLEPSKTWIEWATSFFSSPQPEENYKQTAGILNASGEEPLRPGLTALAPPREISRDFLENYTVQAKKNGYTINQINSAINEAMAKIREPAGPTLTGLAPPTEITSSSLVSYINQAKRNGYTINQINSAIDETIAKVTDKDKLEDYNAIVQNVYKEFRDSGVQLGGAKRKNQQSRKNK